MPLHLGSGLTFPDEAVTQTFALLAVRRAGKSNAAVVMAEEMNFVHLPWVAIDPKGDWWGLQSSGDGKKPGLPIPVFGGLHGDVPLKKDMGELIAELIVRENLTCVLDVSEFDSNADRYRFIADFVSRLFRLHAKNPEPRHIFFEEADDYVPQRVTGQGNLPRCVGAVTKLVKQGGSRGLGCTLISQRSAVVNKDALTQTETMIAMRTTSPQDIEAIRQWVKYQGESDEVVQSLSKLKAGECWVISPHWLGLVERHKFHQRKTFDSGSTPGVGKRRSVATKSDIDLDAIGAALKDAIAEAEASDPRILNSRLAEAQREVARLEDRVEQLQESAREAEIVNVLDDDDKAELLEQIGTLRAIRSEFEAEVEALNHTIDRLVGQLAKLPDMETQVVRQTERPQQSTSRPSVPTYPPFVAQPAPTGGLEDLVQYQMDLLTALCQAHPRPLTKAQLGKMAKKSTKSSAFSPNLKQLYDASLVVRLSDGRYAVSQYALDLMGTLPPPPSGPELLIYWAGKLDAQPARMLQVLAEEPEGLDRLEWAEVSGYSMTSSSFGPSIRELVSLELVYTEGARYYVAEELL